MKSTGIGSMGATKEIAHEGILAVKSSIVCATSSSECVQASVSSGQSKQGI